MSGNVKENKPFAFDVVVKNCKDFEELKAEAVASGRKRTLQMLHSSHEAELHSMINVFTRGSYAVPHNHWIEKEDGNVIKKGESFLALEGAGRIILFTEDGIIERVVEMKAAEQTMVWIPAGVWHTVIALTDFFIIFENKTGPWKAGEDKVFHKAFPVEGDSMGAKYVRAWEICEL
ncbi:MAG: WbuC family cupin fold metalloprotein [Paludibacter sp.]|nr:WbuC family cupin fold metalloprotein [Paludibacter sp.]